MNRFHKHVKIKLLNWLSYWSKNIWILYSFSCFIQSFWPSYPRRGFRKHWTFPLPFVIGAIMVSCIDKVNSGWVTVPSHYLNQCRQIIKRNLEKKIREIRPKHESTHARKCFENCRILALVCQGFVSTYKAGKESHAIANSQPSWPFILAMPITASSIAA